ncbi:MAG: Gfo/Idh/MocA family oxidoreductase [Alistipes sp.]|nr:Gfo/Idh/MocA family oxidoreductase [Alistipes sp.]
MSTNNCFNRPRIGIVGTGKIIAESVAALRTTGWDIHSIWGRNNEKAAVLAERLEIPDVSASYDQLLASGVDFVYIGVANKAHYDYAAKAIEAGVNLLVEKPFCSTLQQAESLAERARERGLYIFETISNLYLPSWAMVRERLADIGNIKLFQADFSQFSSRYKDYLAGNIATTFDPLYEGGALRDINIYNLHLAVSLFGSPDQVVARSTKGYNGVDTSGVVLLTYPSHLAVCTAAKDSGNPSRVVIQGEKGYIYIGGMPNLLPSVEICLHGKEPELHTPNRYDHRLCHQFEQFREIFLRKDFDAMSQALDHTLKVMRVLEMAER